MLHAQDLLPSAVSCQLTTLSLSLYLSLTLSYSRHQAADKKVVTLRSADPEGATQGCRLLFVTARGWPPRG